MPAQQYRETALRMVLCVICYEPVTLHNLPRHRKNAHNKPKGGKLSDHYVEADDEIVDRREFLKIKAIADSATEPDLGVQITTKGPEKSSSAWKTLCEVLKKPDWLRNFRLYLENCQKPGGRSTEESKINAALYENFIQLRILAEEFYSGELANGLNCPVCLEPIDDLPSLRVFIEKKKEKDYFFCGRDPSSSHYLCGGCVRKLRNHPEQYGKCNVCRAHGLYL